MVGSGNLDHTIPVESNDELGELARSFNQMGTDLRNAVKTQLAERQEAEEQLRGARDAALEASRTKSEFLASMSHEIRTPMNAIIGMTDLLSETPINADQAEYLRVISSAGDTLMTLINDILDLSRVEAGQLFLDEVEFDVPGLVENSAEILALRAHEKGLELNSRIAPNAPGTLVGDPVRLRQVLTNLVGNAIKFTDRGEVSIDVEYRPGSPSRGTLEFRVSDTGIGIPEDKLESIFENFTQIDSSSRRVHGGAGLGLAIAGRLARLMGGRLWVDSTLGQGSTFYFTAQVRAPETTEGSPTPALSELDGMKVLIADDNPRARTNLAERIQGWGAGTTEVGDGYQALAEMRRGDGRGEPYHLTFLDQEMPGLGGFEIVRQLRSGTETPPGCVMLLTSIDRTTNVARCKQLGISHYLVKPPRLSDLLRVVRTATRPATATPADPLPATSAPEVNGDRHLRILLAEDSEDNRLVVQAYLKGTTWTLDIAENGEVAVGKFKAGPYDLVLMDMEMPIWDGYSATKLIREWEIEQGLGPTPIIALTAHALKDDALKSLEAGCTDHMTKPIKKATLTTAIYEHTRGDAEWQQTRGIG